MNTKIGSCRYGYGYYSISVDGIVVARRNVTSARASSQFTVGDWSSAGGDADPGGNYTADDGNSTAVAGNVTDLESGGSGGRTELLVGNSSLFENTTSS